MQRACREVRQQLEHVVREAADVEDVLTLGGLRRATQRSGAVRATATNALRTV